MIIKFIKKIVGYLNSTSDKRVRTYIRLICYFRNRNNLIFCEILSKRLQRKYGVFLPVEASFDDTLILRHPTGIVIGTGVKIGRDVIIFQNVTIGRSDTNINSYPKIGNNTVIYVGAVIIGDISIGENCIIGANSVVTHDIPDNSIAVGAPARVVNKNE